MKNRPVCCALVFCMLFCATPVFAREVAGTVYEMDRHGHEQPVKGITIREEKTKVTCVTDSEGSYHLSLPDVFLAGEPVHLFADAGELCIWRPFDGQVRIPAVPLKDPVDIYLVKKGSHRFLSDESFERLVEKMINETGNELRAEKEERKPDLSRYIEEWAFKYGFGLEQVRKEMDRWAAKIEKNREDQYKQGLAEFYRENFSRAGDMFTDLAKDEEAEYLAIKKREAEKREKLVQRYKMAGSSYYNAYRFQDALAAYQKALDFTERARFPLKWADLKNSISIIYGELGTRAEGKAARKYLQEAVKGHHEAMEIYTRKTLPHQWAMTQNNLGITLSDQGKRTGGEAGNRLLTKAVEAYQNALTVYTREALPQDWAMTQNNLAIALRNQGTRTGGEAGTRLLEQAVEAYQNALTVRTREALPQDWAMTQNNLAIALRNQGTRTGGEAGNRLLAEAVEAYRNALTVRTRENLPQGWATTQNNLGVALREQGVRTKGEAGKKLLEQAVQAFKNALEVRTKEHLFYDWEQTTNNLEETYDAMKEMSSE